MPNIASVLKVESSRIARKEVRAEIEMFRKSTAQHRSTIAALRRNVAEIQKELRDLKRLTSKVRQAETGQTSDGGKQRRFSATRLAKHRAKLGLSAQAYGSLVGVTGQTIYNWEQGKSRPRPEQLEAIAVVRALGKREAAEKTAAS